MVSFHFLRLSNTWRNQLNAVSFVSLFICTFSLGNLVEFLQRSGDIHVPFLLSLCGLPMSDATCGAKSAIADRFWKALIRASRFLNLPLFTSAKENLTRSSYLEQNYIIIKLREMLHSKLQARI